MQQGLDQVFEAAVTAAIATTEQVRGAKMFTSKATAESKYIYMYVCMLNAPVLSFTNHAMLWIKTLHAIQ